MDYNKSLSARIRRRNKQGFVDGDHRKWIKTSEYGTIAKEKVNDKYQSIKNFLRKRGYKHAGSKSAKVLKQYM